MLKDKDSAHDSKKIPRKPEKVSPESKTFAEHDVVLLDCPRVTSAANIYDWFDKFKEDCEPWHFSVKNGSILATVKGAIATASILPTVAS